MKLSHIVPTVLFGSLTIVFATPITRAAPTTQASTQPATRPAAGAMNLTNPGFEQHLEGWDDARDNHMSVVASVAAHDGGFGLRVTDDDDAKGSSLASAKFPATPGKSYRCTFWARQVREGHAAVYLQFYDATGKLLTRAADNTAISARLHDDQWLSYTLDGAAPATAATVRIWIHTGNTGKAQADFDEFTLSELGAEATSADGAPSATAATTTRAE